MLITSDTCKGNRLKVRKLRQQVMDEKKKLNKIWVNLKRSACCPMRSWNMQPTCFLRCPLTFSLEAGGENENFQIKNFGTRIKL